MRFGYFEIKRHGWSSVDRKISDGERRFCKLCGKPIKRIYCEVNADNGHDYVYGVGCLEKILKEV